ncbi:MAG: DNA packaging protein [Hyphomicrobiales bacterium]|nr:DNA packaging protein [Hyphomicrobiales bacterium]
MNSSTGSARSTPPSALSLLLRERLDLASELKRRFDTNRLAHYRPYAKQKDFHAAGRTRRERLLRAANQVGKTLAGASEMAMHLTGRYPDWWVGRRFERPITAMAGSESAELTRDGAQRLLLGPPSDEAQWGTGTIPAAALVDRARRSGVTDAVDTIVVRHASGGNATLLLKSYDQGRRKWQANTVDVVWFDEEPPEDVYFEGLTRTNATGGIVWLTFTPLLGMSSVVRRFLLEASPDRHDTNMTIEDAEHIPPEEQAKIVASYPAHEREARIKGVPTLGAGRIFPVADEDIACDSIEIPDHWPRLGAMDFGWDHPFAAVELAWDRDADAIYLTKAYRRREATPVIHAAALKPWGDWLPWMWPRDGHRETLEGAGKALADQFSAQGLAMHGAHAQFDDGSVSVEAGLMEMLDRMQTGRLKVFRHLSEWFEEFRLYHRKEGKVVKEADDLMAATRYGVMMLRHAKTEPKPTQARPPMRSGGWMG